MHQVTIAHTSDLPSNSFGHSFLLINRMRVIPSTEVEYEFIPTQTCFSIFHSITNQCISVKILVHVIYCEAWQQYTWRDSHVSWQTHPCPLPVPQLPFAYLLTGVSIRFSCSVSKTTTLMKQSRCLVIFFLIRAVSETEMCLLPCHSATWFRSYCKKTLCHGPWNA